MGDNDKGKYVVVNPSTRILERSETISHSGNTSYNYVTAVADPNTVLIAYRDDSDGKKGNFFVVNPQTGTVKVSEVTFSSTMINTVAVTDLDSTHVLISYQEYPSHNSYFLLVNPQTGDIVHPKTSFEQSYGIPSAITINSTHALIIYRDLNNYGKFMVVNTVTGQKNPPITYSVNEPYDSSVSSSMLDSNSVLISFWNPIKYDFGNIVVYNIEGTPEILEKTFNSNGATYNTAVVSLGCKVLIAYQDANDHQYGKFVVYTS